MNKTGFTIVELLVSVTIIAVLSTIGFTGYQAVSRGGRDALRKSDLEQIRSALEIYKSENSAYPIAVDCVADLPSDYLNPYPQDPKPAQFQYCYIQNSNLTYDLCAHLENADQDIEVCNGECGANCNYKVSNP